MRSHGNNITTENNVSQYFTHTVDSNSKIIQDSRSNAGRDIYETLFMSPIVSLWMTASHCSACRENTQNNHSDIVIFAHTDVIYTG